MSIRIRLFAVLLVCVPALVLAETPDKLLEETKKQLKETTTALVRVKDADGARAVLPKLDQLDKQIEKVEKEFLRLSKEAGKPKYEFLQYVRKVLAPLNKALDEELLRLDTDEKMHKVFGDNAVVVKFRKAQEQRALVDVQSLSAQLETFKLNNGAYPKKIEELGEKQPNGGLPLVPAEALRDPWGQLYRCDGAGKKNKGRRCDVWSVGHPIEKRVIGNWMKAPPAPNTPKGKQDEKKDSKGTKEGAKKDS